MAIIKNDLDIKLRIAEDEANRLIEKYGISMAEHIRLKDIAYDLGVVVLEGALKGAAASLVRVGKNATIRISPSGSNERKRFSIAHELGHFVLNHGDSLQKICTEEDMHKWYKAHEETEANFFAGELILPKKLIEKKCDVKKVNFGPVKKIAEEFKASLTATSIRFVRFCPEKCAVVFSQNGKIKWCYKSEDWWPFIHIGQKLDPRTLAFDFFNGTELPDESVGVEADSWVEESRLDEIIEHSIGSRELNFVLSLLWIKP